MSDSPRLVPDPPESAARFGDGGDYYRPGLATRQPEHVLAAWFFVAAEEEMPEILTSLRSDVYERLPYDKLSLYHWRNEEDRWHVYEDDWNPPSWAAPASGYVLGSNPMLQESWRCWPSDRVGNYVERRSRERQSSAISGRSSRRASSSILGSR